jgi:thiamine kinase-like enzyme
MNILQIQQSAKALIPDLKNQLDIQITPITGGGNNRAYLIQTKNNRLFAKQYFQTHLDTRDRLYAEYTFSSFAWKNDITNIAKPIAQDKQNLIGFYEYIEGRKLTVSEITTEEISQALKFLITLNNKRELADENLHDASEACFSLIEHFQLVERRIEILQNIKIEDKLDQKAKIFVDNELFSTWLQLKKSSLASISADLLNKKVNQTDKILSPSDFGFHNVLLTTDNKLKFIDFEYAGWDDPAKLIGDFFSQPALPVSMKYFTEFANAVSNLTSEPELTFERIKILLPIIRLKWCCIALNCFAPQFKLHKSFANGISEEFREKQIVKAQNILTSIKQL